MNNKGVSALLAYSLIGGEYKFSYIDDNPKVNECLMDMYFYMLCNGANYEQKKEEYFQEFERKYKELTSEQQLLVRQEYLNIIEAQKKNIEKGRVKKKGMMNDE